MEYQDKNTVGLVADSPPNQKSNTRKRKSRPKSSNGKLRPKKSNGSIESSSTETTPPEFPPEVLAAFNASWEENASVYWALKDC